MLIRLGRDIHLDMPLRGRVQAPDRPLHGAVCHVICLTEVHSLVRLAKLQSHVAAFNLDRQVEDLRSSSPPLTLHMEHCSISREVLQRNRN
jgi:hypothetical protein